MPILGRVAQKLKIFRQSVSKYFMLYFKLYKGNKMNFIDDIMHFTKLLEICPRSAL